MHLGSELAQLRRDGAEVVVDLADGAVVRGDLLLVATGRRPNGDRLDLPADGIPTYPDGRIVVDEYRRRADGLDYAVHVQAYGDVAYGWAKEDDTGFCTVLAERGTRRLLGAHILGPTPPW